MTDQPCLTVVRWLATVIAACFALMWVWILGMAGWSLSFHRPPGTRLHIVKGSRATVAFRAPRATWYRVMLAYRRPVPSAHRDALVGVGWAPPVRPALRVAVTGTGVRRPRITRTAAGVGDVCLGTFECSAGTWCQVTATAQETTPWIDRLDPDLYVSEYGPRIWSTQIFLCYAPLPLGTFLIAGLLWLRAARQRRRAAS